MNNKKSHHFISNYGILDVFCSFILNLNNFMNKIIINHNNLNLRVITFIPREYL